MEVAEKDEKQEKLYLQWNSKGEWIRILLVGDKINLNPYAKWLVEKTNPYSKDSERKRGSTNALTKGYLNLGTRKNFCVEIEYQDLTAFEVPIMEKYQRDASELNDANVDGIIIIWNNTSQLCTDKHVGKWMVDKSICKRICYIDGDVSQATRFECAWIWQREGEELIEYKMRAYIKSLLFNNAPQTQKNEKKIIESFSDESNIDDFAVYDSSETPEKMDNETPIV